MPPVVTEQSEEDWSPGRWAEKRSSGPGSCHTVQGWLSPAAPSRLLTAINILLFLNAILHLKFSNHCYAVLKKKKVLLNSVLIHMCQARRTRKETGTVRSHDGTLLLNHIKKREDSSRITGGSAEKASCWRWSSNPGWKMLTFSWVENGKIGRLELNYSKEGGKKQEKWVQEEESRSGFRSCGTMHLGIVSS